jgi:RNA polymerase sigma-70 factor (ECF subfamily)
VGQELVVRFVAGDRDAFGAIFDRLHGDLHRLVRRFFRGAFDQEEALQEVWLKLYRMRDRFDVNRSEEFVPWSRQVARNCCIDLLKARGRSHEIPVAETEATCEACQVTALAGRHARQVLAEFVARLDQEEQRFFDLCFVEELAHEEIAKTMDLSVRRSKYLKKKLLARMLRSGSLRRVGET